MIDSLLHFDYNGYFSITDPIKSLYIATKELRYLLDIQNYGLLYATTNYFD